MMKTHTHCLLHWLALLHVVSGLQLLPSLPALQPHAVACCCRGRTTALVAQLFPGDDPLKFVRTEARKTAMEKLAAMEAEEGVQKSQAFREAYADAYADIEVQEFQDELEGRPSKTVDERIDDVVPETKQPSAVAVACVDSEAVSINVRERVVQEIVEAGGICADETEEQREVYFALPDGLQSALASGSIANLKLALALMRDDEVEYHRKCCLEAGLWVAGGE